jgi:uroporphyrinogen-III synthase
VLFSSTNSVDAVWEQMNKLGIERVPENVRMAANGPKTAEALEAHGIIPSFVPDEYVSEAIPPGLDDLTGRWVLLPRADIARKALPKAIVAAGGIAHEIVVYRTLPAEADAEGLVALEAGVDVITFTSPSTVYNFVQILRKNGLDPFNLPSAPKIACIGPITGKAAKEEGFDVTIVAQNYTTEGLIEAIGKL